MASFRNTVIDRVQNRGKATPFQIVRHSDIFRYIAFASSFFRYNAFASNFYYVRTKSQNDLQFETKGVHTRLNLKMQHPMKNHLTLKRMADARRSLKQYI